MRSDSPVVIYGYGQTLSLCTLWTVSVLITYIRVSLTRFTLQISLNT